MLKLSDEAVNWLKTAGRMIQYKSKSNIFFEKIVREGNESYPMAVLRVVHNMDADKQSKLFDAVEWSDDYLDHQSSNEITEPHLAQLVERYAH